MKKQYKIIKLPKGDGKFRTLYAPSKAYKEKLASFLLDLQQKIHDADSDYTIHGFMRGRGPVSNAHKHVGYAYTLSLDLKDFFDSVKAEMVKEYLSEEELELCFIDGIARQGLPTSPLIANLAFLKLDAKIKDAIAEEGVYAVYTRYADDLIFSFNHIEFAKTLETLVEKIISDGGFLLNRKKTKLQSAERGRRMITGIGVDERGIYPSRKLKRRIRAAVHQKNRENAFGLLSWAECREPRAFYTDRDLLNKNIFKEEALDISNDFYLSDLLSFEAYVAAIEADFEDSSLAHEHDREKWERQKGAFLAQRDAFYQKEKKRAQEDRKETRKDIERHFAAEEEEKKEVSKPQQKKAAQRPSAQANTTAVQEKKEERAKELNIDFDALKEIENEQVSSFQDEKKARRRTKEAAEHANEEREEKKRLQNKVFIASVFPIVLLIGIMSYYFSATKVELKESYPLIIETVPYDAKIQIMNIMPKYKIGIELKPGDYDIQISKKGYTTQRFTIKMEHSNIIIKRELQKIKKRKVY
ncbi:MAG: reverse transcriptase domain-containing protein [Campylobacterota bacterium]